VEPTLLDSSRTVCCGKFSDFQDGARGNEDDSGELFDNSESHGSNVSRSGLTHAFRPIKANWWNLGDETKPDRRSREFRPSEANSSLLAVGSLRPNKATDPIGAISIGSERKPG
jgi:hypothetical protein